MLWIETIHYDSLTDQLHSVVKPTDSAREAIDVSSAENMIPMWEKEAICAVGIYEELDGKLSLARWAALNINFLKGIDPMNDAARKHVWSSVRYMPVPPNSDAVYYTYVSAAEKEGELLLSACKKHVAGWETVGVKFPENKEFWKILGNRPIYCQAEEVELKEAAPRYCVKCEHSIWYTNGYRCSRPTEKPAEIDLVTGTVPRDIPKLCKSERYGEESAGCCGKSGRFYEEM